ncbi:MAG: TetR/AcrR family transcriptional regulator [Candidatus Hydrogenedentes bacterium]|nr:TetR/AcrR family transcriptional regulator [Candidatus Hydrogenedentota bacterium]
MPRMCVARDQLMSVAEKLVHQRGFRATSVNDVLAEAGVTKGALYHYFPGKDDLEMAVLERAGAAFLKCLDEVLAGPSPRECLEHFFASALKHHRKERFVGGCLFGNTALEMSDTNRRHAVYVEGIFDQWTNKIEAVTRAGQSAGQIRNDIGARDLAQTVVATIEGGIMLSRLGKNERPLRTCLESLRTFLWTRRMS